MSDAAGELPINMGTVKVMRETPKALLVTIGKNEVWIPQSCVHDDSEVWHQGHVGKFVVKAWFARKQGWEL